MGAGSKDERLLAEVPAVLAGLLGVAVGDVIVGAPTSGAGLVLSAVRRTFVVQWVGSSSAGPVAAGAEKAGKLAKGSRRRAIPLVAVPFMSEAGRRACEAAQAAWLDLSGNACIMAPGIRVMIDGRPNRFRSRGRPASLFAPKSARIARWFLMHPDEACTQRQLARVTGTSEGLVSRIASRLEHEDYVVREPSGALHAKQPRRLLDAWSEAYRFSQHALVPGHVAARSGDALTRFLSDTLAAENVEHAATGLAAAWQMTRFASFRLATFFVHVALSGPLRAKLGFREVERGANVWIVVPNDAGVFHGVGEWHGVRCVHPVQAYLDLKAHPERAPEAAERLRAELMDWRRDA